MKTGVLGQVKRYLLLCVGLTIMAFGVAFSIKAGLGTSPISSLPYVISLLTPLTVGTAPIAMHVALIACKFYCCAAAMIPSSSCNCRWL